MPANLRYFCPMKRILPLVFLAFGPTIHAQTGHLPHEHRGCGAQVLTRRHLERQGLGTDLLHLLPAPQANLRGGTFTIPVVVHVVWNTSSENIPTATINSIIDRLNEDYSATNTDLATVRPAFAGVVGNVGFQFCLAQVDPNGNPTTGIVRRQTTDTWFDPDTETDDMKLPPTGSAAWDPSRYLNIWICDITSGVSGNQFTVGYAYLPVGGVVGSAIDGLVIDYNLGTDAGSRTATHEVGHYFGLLHPFDEGGSCVNADGFTDTPTTNSPTFSCSNSNLIKCGVLTQYENFMDYGICQVMFTDQQAAYMAGVLTNQREGLLLNPACSGPGTGLCIPISSSGTADGDYINRVALGTINNANTGGIGQPTYTDYSATLSTSLIRGSQYTLSVQGGTFDDDNVAAWIDYDQDEVLEAAEKLGETDITQAGQTVTITFTVPAGASLGATVLRVRNVFHNTGEPVPTDPCFAYDFGETEDYGITIQGGGGGPCIPTSASGTADGDFINSMVLNEITNINSGGVGGPTYTDYSSTGAATVVRNGHYSLLLQSGTFTSDAYSAWIDYDQDDLFESNERLGTFNSSQASQSGIIPFVVPVTATLGTTTLRIRGVYPGTGDPFPIDPCFAYEFGETEDYSVNILAAPSDYCTPGSVAGPGDGDFINSVELGSISTTNTGGPNGPAYTDYSASESTSLLRDGEYMISIGSGEFAPDTYTAWIDYDQDDLFEPSENLGTTQNATAGEVVDLVFTVPGTAAVGITRMRVRGVFQGSGEPDPMDPCYPYAYGETEDYQVLIQFGTEVDETGRNALQPWPNPTTGMVNLMLHHDGPAEIRVCDTQGREVARTSLGGRMVELDVSHLAAGYYVIHVRQGEQGSSARLEVLHH